MSDNISSDSQLLAQKAAEAQLMLGIAVALQIENSSLRKDAWKRAGERLQETAEQAMRLSKSCCKRSRS